MALRKSAILEGECLGGISKQWLWIVVADLLRPSMSSNLSAASGTILVWGCLNIWRISFFCGMQAPQADIEYFTSILKFLFPGNRPHFPGFYHHTAR
jgi:hypothetical protein